MQNETEIQDTCPAQQLLKMLSGKWKPEIFKLAVEGPLRFNSLLRLLNGSSRQSISVALRELEDSGLLVKKVIREKPLHIEYTLTAAGLALIPIFLQLEEIV